MRSKTDLALTLAGTRKPLVSRQTEGACILPPLTT